MAVVRLDDDLHERLRQRAEREARPITRELGLAVEAWLGPPLVVPPVARLREEAADHEAAKLEAMGVEMPAKDCPHPQHRRVGPACTACGQIVGKVQ